jgi:hypothetical protein
MNWYEKALQAAHRIDPGHISPWKLAGTYALLSLAQSLASQPRCRLKSIGIQRHAARGWLESEGRVWSLVVVVVQDGSAPCALLF